MLAQSLSKCCPVGIRTPIPWFRAMCPTIRRPGIFGYLHVNYIRENLVKYLLMNLITLIGLAAAAMTTFAFLPQAVKSWRSRRTDNLSLPMYLVMATGIALWLIYGLIIRDIPLIFANSISFIFVSSILYLKIRHG